MKVKTAKKRLKGLKLPSRKKMFKSVTWVKENHYFRCTTQIRTIGIIF